MTATAGVRHADVSSMPEPKSAPPAGGDWEYHVEVQAEARRIGIRKDARALYEQEHLPAAPPFDAGLLTEILARPAEPPYRIPGLIPSAAATLVVAQRKTGKTTFLLNLARSLITGDDFLGEFTPRPIAGRVAILNFEVSGSTLAHWASDHRLPADRLLLVNLRGRRNPLQHDEDRAELADLLRKAQTEALIVDPFGRAYTGGQSQNDPGEVGSWLANLDRFARVDTGATDLILAAHAGWDGERTRGASALEDWADSIITIARRKEDPTDEGRYLRAFGRDVDIAEDLLAYDQNTRRLTLTGVGSRRQRTADKHLATLTETVVQIITDTPGLNGVRVAEALRTLSIPFQKGDERKALAHAVEAGNLRIEHGARGAKNYFPTAPTPTYPDIPRGAGADVPHVPLIEKGYVSGVPQALGAPTLCLIHSCNRPAVQGTQFCEQHPDGAA